LVAIRYSLEEVLGVLRRADDPVGVELQLTPVGVRQLAERVLVACACTGQSLLGHAPHPRTDCSVRRHHDY
jgi:hypothetical protein